MTNDFRSDPQLGVAAHEPAASSVPGAPGGVVDSYELSPMQAGMLFHAVGQPVPGVDIEQVVIVLDEALDEARFARAWDKTLARHAILRCRFRWTGSSHPVQEVLERIALPVRSLDWRALPALQRKERFDALLAEDRIAGFDLGSAPLLRLTLVRIAEAQHSVLWTFHHALLDGRSFSLVLREAFALYEMPVHATAGDLPDPRPYRQYIEWLRGIDHEKAREYWQRTLAGFRAPTPLVVAREREPESEIGAVWGTHETRLSAESTAALNAQAREASVTLNNLVQGAWALLLNRYSGENDVVFGATRACRKSALGGAYDMVGLFINTLPLRVKIDPEAELGTWLQALRAQQLALRDYEHTPLVRVQGWSEVQRGTPLFETLVVYEHETLDAQMRVSGERWATRALQYYGQTNFPLTVAAYGGEQLLLQLQYSRRRFQDAAARRMLTHLQTLLESIANSTSARLRDLAMVPQAERRDLVSKWNVARTYTRGPGLHERFERQAAATPDAVAVVYENERLSYAALNRHANRIAHHLRKLGVQRGALVGLRVERSIDMVVGILGILKSGAAYLPLDPAYPKARVKFMVRDSGVSIVLTHSALAQDLEGVGATPVLLDAPLEEAVENPLPVCEPDDLAYVIYTSGSTGTPKGVQISHYNVTRLFEATQDWYRFDASDVWTLFHSYAFDFSVWELWGALLYGGRVIVVPYWVSRSPEAFRELLIRERVTVLNQTPSAFRQLIHADLAGSKADLALRSVIFGGEALELQTLRPWFERYGDERPLLVNMYGITETTVHVTYRPIRMRDIESGAGSVIGQPIPDLQLYLLDAAGEPVPIGVPAEIHVGGAGVARGYLNRSELTAQRFIPDPFSGIPGSRLYRTGDLARRLESGDVEYLGRIDHQVKIRGFRIELGEIEAGIARHPWVREVCVIAREDVPGERRLVAYLVAKNAAPELVSQLRDALRESMPEYMVPAHFVMLEALPLTENGKVDRKALPPPGTSAIVGRRYVGPRSAMEQTIAEIWSAVLGVPHVGVEDNFFELGGDSILSIQVIARCREAGLHLNSRDLFDRPTIAQLAATSAQTSKRLEPQGPVSGAVQLTPIQRWFVEADIAHRDHWNQALLFEVPEDLDLDALARALDTVVHHHDALRLRLRFDGGEWVQEYGEINGDATGFARFDLSGASAGERSALLVSHAAQVQAALNLARGPILRAAHFALGPGEPGRLLIVVHHLAVDGISWRLLREDLESAYLSLKKGRAPAFPAKSTSFQRWAERLTEFARSAGVQRSLDFWVAEGRKSASGLPSDGGSTTNLEGEVRTVNCRLGCEETQALLQHAPRAYRSQINDLLLTALAIALHGSSGGAAFRIDLEGHGREELFQDVDLTRTVGWFTSLFPVRLEIDDAGDMARALKSVKEQLRRIPDRGLSYGLLRYCGDAASRSALAALPASELLFNYLGQFDQIVAGSRLFRFAHESAGPWRGADARRSHLLEVLCWVRNGELEVRWIHHPRIHRAETIEALAQAYIQALRTLVSHCLGADSGGRTPSDFPLAHVTQHALDELWRRYPQFDDLYPLSPIQRLYFVMEKSHSSIGVEPWHFRIEGEVNAAHLRAAIESVVQRHPILRTAFVTPAAEPLQLVLPRVAVSWTEEDWRGLPEDALDTRLAEAKRQEMMSGFDVAQPPLLRARLCRSGETTWHLLWTTHHLCIDGWTWPLVFRDSSSIYEALADANVPQLERATAYRDYIAWLCGKAPDSEAFWRQTLVGFTAPTPIHANRKRSAAIAEGPYEVFSTLDECITSRLQSLARNRHVTLSTMVQAAWALVLSHYSAKQDVVFGAAFSGRPGEVPGIARLVGPCVNNVPVRVRIPSDAPLLAWLAELQGRHVELSQHQYAPPEKIQAWSEVPWRYRLFDSLIVFQNYSVDEAARRLGRSARIEPVSTPQSTRYPLTITVTPGEALGIRFIYPPGELTDRAVEGYANDLLRMLRAMAEQPECSVSDLLTLLPIATRGATAREHEWPSPRSAAPYEAPGTDMEHALASLWQELLGVEGVSMEDNFFDLGGHSLLLIQAHRRLCELLQRDLPVVSLLQYPTIRSLARHVDGIPDPQLAARGAAERARKQREALRRQRMNAGVR